MSFRKRTTPAQEPQTAPATKVADKPQAKGKYTFVKLGAIIEKKNDEGVYIKLDGGKEGILPEITVNGKKVTGFQVEDPTLKYQRMADANKITQAEADEKAALVPSYVLFEVTAITE